MPNHYTHQHIVSCVCLAIQMAQVTGGQHQRTDILGEGTASHLQAAILHIALMDRIVEGTPGIATDGARGRRDRHPRWIVMADTTARTPGSEVLGHL
jgi:hypothetical protein